MTKAKAALAVSSQSGRANTLRRVGQRSDHQPVPVGQHLVVPAGADAPGAARKQLGAHGGERLLLLRGAELEVGEAVEDGVAFPVALVGDVVGLAEKGRVHWAQDVDDLGLAPDVELALLALAVGIERSGKAAALGDHLALQPVDRFLDARLVELVAALAVGLAQQVDEQRVVVEHLLEVRRQPTLVHRVAREAAAQVIVDAALANVGERDVHRLARREIAVADGAAPQQPEEAPLRKLGRAGEAAAAHVHRIDHAPGEIGQRRILDVGFGTGLFALGERLDQQGGVVADLVGLIGGRCAPPRRARA